MSGAELTVEQQIDQLNQAKQLVLQDASFYPQIIRGILPIIRKPDVRLRSWCATFLVDGFASADVPLNEKQSLATACLDAIQMLLLESDILILKNTIQSAASIYPFVFKYICMNKSDEETWTKMSAIKSRILQLWDGESKGVRLCCIKFVQKVIATQTPGPRDPRLIDESDVSLNTVNSSHPILHHTILEAEAQGLLDRLLSVFYEQVIDESIVSATLYVCGVLIKTRSMIAGKILNIILMINPLTADYGSDDLDKCRLEIRFIERNLRILLGNILKVNSLSNLYGTRIQQYLSQLVQSKNIGVEELARKRAALEESRDSPAKRQKTDSPAATISSLVFNPAPMVKDSEGRVSYSNLYTLIGPSLPLSNFDVKILPPDIITEIAIAGISTVAQQDLTNAIELIKQRYNSLTAPSTIQPSGTFKPTQLANIPTLKKEYDDDDDEYEPEYEPDYEPPDVIVQPYTPIGSDTKTTAFSTGSPRLQASLQSSQSLLLDAKDGFLDIDEGERYREMSIDSDFVLPPPKPLTPTERFNIFQKVVERIFINGEDIEKNVIVDSTNKTGSSVSELNNILFGGDMWIMLLSRLGTRGLFKVSSSADGSKAESLYESMSQLVREKLFSYIMADFRQRIDVAVVWLSEEWYNEKLKQKSDRNGISNSDTERSKGNVDDANTTKETLDTSGSMLLQGVANDDSEQSHYLYWTSRLLDNMIPFLEAKDRLFLRFLSDLPELTAGMISKLRTLCLDPDRSKLGFLALQYLIMMRPPVRSTCLDFVQYFYQNHPDTKLSTSRILQKYRPEAIIE
ncbi:hypothetical protein V1511DRAFT_496801 [Dipodascopsis uninucleata]